MIVRAGKRKDRAAPGLGHGREKKSAAQTVDTSNGAVMALLKRIEEAHDLNEVRQLSEQLERAIFHRQYTGA